MYALYIHLYNYCNLRNISVVYIEHQATNAECDTQYSIHDSQAKHCVMNLGECYHRYAIRWNPICRYIMRRLFFLFGTLQPHRVYILFELTDIERVRVNRHTCILTWPDGGDGLIISQLDIFIYIGGHCDGDETTYNGNKGHGFAHVINSHSHSRTV